MRAAKKGKGRRGSTSSREGAGSGADNSDVDDEDEDDDYEDGFSSEAESVVPEGSPVVAVAESARSNSAGAPQLQQSVDKLCISLAVSPDGTLAVAGCTDRVLSVIDAARPGNTPLAQVRVAKGTV